jgi:hypothetical protein
VDFLPNDSSDSATLWSPLNAGFRVLNPAASSPNRMNMHPMEFRQQDDTVDTIAQSRGLDVVPIATVLRADVADSRFVNAQLVNGLRQGPTEAVTIYQTEIFSGQNNPFESQIEETEPSHQGQMDKLRSELQLALQSNDYLRRQIKEGMERENALIDQLYGDTAINGKQRSESEQIGLSVSEGYSEGLRTELQKAQIEMMDVQRRLVEREAELAELRSENEYALTLQREVGAPLVVQKINWQGVSSRGQLNSLPTGLLEQIKVVKKKFSKSSPKSRILKIECVMNEVLFEQFEAAKKRLDFVGRPSEEQILFHGTGVFNINRYFAFPLCLMIESPQTDFELVGLMAM